MKYEKEDNFEGIFFFHFLNDCYLDYFNYGRPFFEA